MGFHHLKKLRESLIDFCRELQQTYGDASCFRVGPFWMFLMTSPELVQEVLVKQARRMHKPARLKQVLGRWDGQGLVLSDGELWIRQRRLVQGAFHPRRLQGYAASMSEITTQSLGTWPKTGTIDVAEAMADLTLRIACKTLFGFEVRDQASRIAEAVQTLQDATMRDINANVVWPNWFPGESRRREREDTKYLLGIIDDMIQRWRVDRKDRGDLLSMLLLAVDEEGDGKGMPEKQARDEAMTAFLAGHETTATALTWTLFLLAKYPSVQDQAAALVARQCPDRTVTFADLPRLTLIEQIVKESMRLYPPVYFTSREVAEQTEINGWRLPKKSQVFIVPYLLHRDPRWFEQPDEFRPERFAGDFEERLPPCTYIPFGAGPRACIGRGFAMIEAQLVLANLLRQFRVSLPAGASEPVMEMQISLHPKGGLRLDIAQRVPMHALHG
jgi:cytochrome P450